MADEVHPKVFILYSHDSDDYKNFVRAFADRLISEGVDTTLDQYDFVLGDKNPEFMEQAVKESDFVLIFITNECVQKGEEIFIHGNRHKFIPVFIKMNLDDIPDCLKGANAVSISSLVSYEKEYEQIYRVVTNQTLKKPELGKIRRISSVANKTVFDTAELCKRKNVDQWVIFDCILELSCLSDYTMAEIYREILKNRTSAKDSFGRKISYPCVLSDFNKKSHKDVILYESSDRSGCSNLSSYDRLQVEDNLIRYSYIELSERRSHCDMLLNGKHLIITLVLLIDLIAKTIASFQKEPDVSCAFNFETTGNVIFHTPDHALLVENTLSSYELAGDKQEDFTFKNFDDETLMRFINRILEKFTSENQEELDPFLRLNDENFSELKERWLNGNFDALF